MAKLYVANLVILNPRDISSCDNKIKTYDSETILVKKTLFGYEEVFTKHMLYKTDALRRNYGVDDYMYMFIIGDSYIYKNLKEGKMQFVLDKNKSFPLKEAEEKDAKKYIDNFEKSAIKRYYDQQEEALAAERAEIERKIASKKRAKKLIKESKYNLQKH